MVIPPIPIVHNCKILLRKQGWQNEKGWNSALSSVRVSVEWIFKEIINYFKFLDFKKDLRGRDC